MSNKNIHVQACTSKFNLVFGTKCNRKQVTFFYNTYMYLALCDVMWIYSENSVYNEILGTGIFCIFCYISHMNQYKSNQINSLGLEKIVCYIRYFVVSDLFIYRVSTVSLNENHNGVTATLVRTRRELMA